jgi:Ser/Thr protein kinase RdoA (MazF antagonist)
MDVIDCLDLWSETEGGKATLINHSENRTFLVEGRDGLRTVLRVHRPGYQSEATVGSELEWLEALRAEGRLPVPRPLPGRDGRLVQRIARPGGDSTLAVLFAHEPGAEPCPEDDLAGLFETLGRFAALAHDQAARFRPSPGFTRQVWTAASILDGTGPWGDWRAAPGVEGPIAENLERLARRLHADLAAYGQGPDRFGLIHADMRLANLLVEGERVTLIDFDDCGFCWFLYDFAAAISFFEDTPQVPELRRRWLKGYTAVRPLATADIGIVDTMILLRRMALLAFIGSHRETDLAKAHAPDFASRTAALARPYLATG